MKRNPPRIKIKKSPRRRINLKRKKIMRADLKRTSLRRWIIGLNIGILRRTVGFVSFFSISILIYLGINPINAKVDEPSEIEQATHSPIYYIFAIDNSWI